MTATEQQVGDAGMAVKNSLRPRATADVAQQIANLVLDGIPKPIAVSVTAMAYLEIGLLTFGIPFKLTDAEDRDLLNCVKTAIRGYCEPFMDRLD